LFNQNLDQGRLRSNSMLGWCRSPKRDHWCWLYFGGRLHHVHWHRSWRRLPLSEQHDRFTIGLSGKRVVPNGSTLGYLHGCPDWLRRPTGGYPSGVLNLGKPNILRLQIGAGIYGSWSTSSFSQAPVSAQSRVSRPSAQ